MSAPHADTDIVATPASDVDGAPSIEGFLFSGARWARLTARTGRGRVQMAEVLGFLSVTRDHVALQPAQGVVIYDPLGTWLLVGMLRLRGLSVHIEGDGCAKVPRAGGLAR